jgi:hypothetical protein
MTAMELAILKAIEERLAAIEFRITTMETQLVYRTIIGAQHGQANVSL